jgi:hypothetical protein
MLEADADDDRANRSSNREARNPYSVLRFAKAARITVTTACSAAITFTKQLAIDPTTLV